MVAGPQDISARRRGALLDIGALACACALAVAGIRAPEPRGTGAPPEEFSAARAMAHVERLARGPRPVGSTGHAEAERYIEGELRKLGLAAAVQQTQVATGFAGWIHGATVRNITARLSGNGGEERKTILLVAHYDSVPNSPGAADDAAGVATLLETLRALRAGPPLEHDVLFLFDDGEELGLLGAAAFVSEDAAATTIDLALNFEARGNAGPSAMFETSAGNARLIEELGHVRGRLYASSCIAALARLLPNDTDLTVLRNAGITGLNFAFADHLHRYHSATDDPRRLDRGSLQHHGDYALALTRTFANSERDWAADGDAIYFDLLGRALVSYGPVSAWLLALLGCGGLVATLVVAQRRGAVSLRGCMWGAAMQILTLLACVLAVQGAAVGMLYLVPRDLLLASNRWFCAGYLAIALAVTSALALWRRPRREEERWFATVGLWAACGLGTTAFAPGASYVFCWVVMFSAAGAALWLWVAPSLVQRAAIALLRGAAVFVIATLVYMVFLVDGGLLPAVPLGLAAFAWGLVAEPVSGLPARARRWLPAVGLGLGVAILGLGALGIDFGADNPRRSTVHYAVDADTGRSYWLSVPGEQDPWLAQFFRRGYARGGMAQFTPYAAEVISAEAVPVPDLPPPIITIASEARQGDFRRLDVVLQSPRGAACMTVWRPENPHAEPDDGAEITAAELGGRTIPTLTRISTRSDTRVVEFLLGVTRATWKLYYCGAASEPVRLRLWTLPAEEPLRLRVVDESFGLPGSAALSISPRPPASAPAQRSELILVAKAYDL